MRTVRRQRDARFLILLLSGGASLKDHMIPPLAPKRPYPFTAKLGLVRVWVLLDVRRREPRVDGLRGAPSDMLRPSGPPLVDRHLVN